MNHHDNATSVRNGRLQIMEKLCLCICLLLLWPPSGCDRQHVTEKSKGLALSLEGKSPQPQGSGASPATNSGRGRIYIDASLSMSGYIAGVPERRTAFDEVIDKLAEYLPGCSVFKFGQGTQQTLISPASFDRNLHNPAFYNLTYNPNDLLIQKFNSEEEPSLSIILTDGVQSDVPGQGNPPVVDAIQAWMEKGYTFAIMRLSSRFEGPFYTELRRNWLINDKGLKRFSIPSRPFYLFVFSPTRYEFEELRRKILQDFSDTKVMLFSDDSISCAVKASPGVKKPYAASMPGKEPIFWQRYNADLFDKKSPVSELKYEVRCSMNVDYPVKELALTAIAGCYLWKSGSFDPEVSPLPTGFKSEVEPRNQQQPPNSFILNIGLTPDSRSAYTFYHIQVSATSGALRDDIMDVNTDDDSDPRNTGKTYKLSSLIKTLAEIHMKTRLAKRISPSIYLTIANN